MDKSAVRKVVSGWLKETKLEEGESFGVFPEHNHLTIRIIKEGLYRDERKHPEQTLPRKEKREGVQYGYCPKCQKKGMRDVNHIMSPLEKAMSLFKYGGKICKYCGYAEYLVPKDGKVEKGGTMTFEASIKPKEGGLKWNH